MFNTIKDNLLRPLVTRIGSVATGLLVGAGVAQEPAHQIGLGVGAAILLIRDLFGDWLNRRHTLKTGRL